MRICNSPSNRPCEGLSVIGIPFCVVVVKWGDLGIMGFVSSLCPGRCCCPPQHCLTNYHHQQPADDDDDGL